MRVMLVMALATFLLASGCGRSAESARSARQISAAALDGLQIGHTSRAEVERAFGPPDEHGADGAMIYHADVVRRPGHAHRETLTLRFEGDVLSKLCRSRVGEHA